METNKIATRLSANSKHTYRDALGRPVTIALISDRAILPGAHATLASLLSPDCERPDYHIHYFHHGLKPKDLVDLEATFAIHAKSGDQFSPREFLTPVLPGANPLLGNWMTYGRLFLSELLPEDDFCWYLDVDLLITSPLTRSAAGGLDGIVMAGGVEKRKHSLDRQLFIAAGLDLDGPCFNAGVLALDLRRWRDGNFFEQCVDILKKYPGMFRSADQALLNVLVGNDFVCLDKKYNHALYPDSPALPRAESGMIYHFVGTPKPWDPMGSVLHRNYHLWRDYYQKSALASRSTLRYCSMSRLRGASPSIARLLSSRITRRITGK